MPIGLEPATRDFERQPYRHAIAIRMVPQRAINLTARP